MTEDTGHHSGPATAARGGVTDARVAAADVCADLRAGELLDSSFERRVESLDARDRRWTQELLYGMLRRRAWLDAALSERVRGGLARLDPDLTDILRLGVYQLLFMRSVPPYAAIAQSVELAKRRHGLGASKLVNAVLRRVDRERETIPFPPVPRAEPGTSASRSDRRARAVALASALARRALGRALGRRGYRAAARGQQRRGADHPAPVRRRARAARGDARERGRARRGRAARARQHSRHRQRLARRARRVSSGTVLRAGPGRDAGHSLCGDRRRAAPSPTCARRPAARRSSCRARPAPSSPSTDRSSA